MQVPKISKDIISLEKLLKDEAKLKDIASRLVRLAIQNAAEEKLNRKIKTPTIQQEVRVGEIVPANLAGIVPVDGAGKAASSWERSWLDLIVWTRVWSESGAMIGLNPEIRASILGEVRFTAEERRVLKELNIQV